MEFLFFSIFKGLSHYYENLKCHERKTPLKEVFLYMIYCLIT